MRIRLVITAISVMILCAYKKSQTIVEQQGKAGIFNPASLDINRHNRPIYRGSMMWPANVATAADSLSLKTPHRDVRNEEQ